MLGHSFADHVGALPPSVALAQSWVLTASAHLRLGSTGIVWYLLPARIAGQGVGNVTVCANARTGVSLESGSQGLDNAVAWRRTTTGSSDKRGTNRTLPRPCRNPWMLTRLLTGRAATPG